MGGNAMKKVIRLFTCMLLLMVCIFTIPACNEEPKDDFITANTQGASFSGSEVVFKNADDFKLTYQGDHHYVATGSASKMTDEQATAWGTVANSKFIVVTVKMGADSNAIIGWRNNETKSTAFTTEEIDGSLVKRSTAKNDSKNYILAISDGDTARHPDLKVWRIEVTKKDSTEVITYTVDFSTLY